MTPPIKHGTEDIYNRLGTLEQAVASITPTLRSLSEDLKSIKDRQNAPVNWIGFGSLIVAVLLYLNTVLQPVNARLDKAEESLGSQTELVYSAPGRLETLEDWMRQTQIDKQNLIEKAAQHDKSIDWHDTWLTFVEQQLDTERARNANIEQRVSRLEGETKIMIQDNERAKDFDLESNYIHGQRQEMGERVKDIDNLGSRFHNSSAKDKQ